MDMAQIINLGLQTLSLVGIVAALAGLGLILALSHLRRRRLFSLRKR
jgi:hypothetical protein